MRTRLIAKITITEIKFYHHTYLTNGNYYPEDAILLTCGVNRNVQEEQATY